MFLEDGGRGEEGRGRALCACNLLSGGRSGKPMGGSYDVSKFGVFFNTQSIFPLEGVQANYSQL